MPSREERRTILFVANEIGHFRHHREHLVRAAAAAGLAPILVSAPVGNARDFPGIFLPLTIPRFALHPFHDLRLFFMIVRLLLAERPQAVHLLSIKPYLFGGLAARTARLLGWRGRVVITVPGLGRLYDTAANSLPARIRRRVVEFFLRFATHGATVTFETEHDREFWLQRRLIDPSQAVVTRGAGIDLSRFQPSETPASERGMRVLFAGRLLWSKGLDVFIHAGTRLIGSGLDMQVAGFIEDDPDAVPVEVLTTSPGIRFLGAVGDMPPLLSQTDVVVLPSRYNEGVPRILIEAAACGCVPVATRFAGSMALIEEGESGFFIDGDSVESLSAHLAAVLRDLAGDRPRRLAVGREAASHVRSSGFSDVEIAAVFMRLYGVAAPN